jgi:hypothetical protein
LTHTVVFFKVISIATLCIAAFHLLGIFITVNQSPPWRHAVFAAICFLLVYGFVNRPKYFKYLFVILAIQQFYSHGGSILQQWKNSNTIDWISILLLLSILVISIILWAESRTAKRI